MPFSKKEKKLSQKDAYLKISAWCAYQERCHQEVRSKLYEYGLMTDEIDELIFKLISENFLNEERFARAYAGGKFRMKKWGRLKIKNELKMRDISNNCLKAAMEEISDEDYFETIRQLIEKKEAEYKSEKNDFLRKRKVAESIVRKGFESDLVWEILKSEE
jgi:regulatory protein